MSDISPDLLQYWLIVKQIWYIVVISVVLLGIFIGFVLRFVRPALHLRAELQRAIDALTAMKGRPERPNTDLEEIGKAAMKSDPLAHLWSEYTKTLHPERREDNQGQLQIVRWRATALAETFFREQTIVDKPLKTEFYKHLPGILTGLGIIGTFTGLIIGLRNFQISSNDPERAQQQLTELVNTVGHAFFVSAVAIGMAMLFTWIEKALVTSRYRQVEELGQLIDSLFDAGVGEEYLQRIVMSSEMAATQAAHIKDALVADLKQILTQLTTQQIEAAAKHSIQISADMGQVISEHLGGPISDIAAAVRNVSTNQGEAVNKMLTDVLASFSAQMQEVFGGQMRGMNDLLVQTSQAMRNTATKFEQLASNMDSAGKEAVEAMTERLNHAITSVEARQQTMNKQMGEFVEQIRASVAESQTQSGRKLQETLASVGDQVAGVIAELRRQAEEAADRQGQRQQRFEESTGGAVNTLSGHMERLLVQSAETNQSLQASVAKLAAATDQAIAGMNAGAETLFVAASDFAKAGDGVSETMRASATATETIRAAAQTLSTAADAARDVIEEHSRTRDVFALMVSDLKSTVESANREASLTSEIVSKFESASSQLAAAQRQAEEYLKGVTEVLSKAHESFAENVQRTLREGNRQFQKELSEAVGLLSGAIKDLGDTLDDRPTKK